VVKIDLFNGVLLCSTCPANYMICDSINHTKNLVCVVLYYVIVLNVLKS